jgi:MOSC domain-containing protein YiiM
MTVPGRVEVVSLRPGPEPLAVIVGEAQAIAGGGLVGDRYSGSGRRGLTLIERAAYEHLESIGLGVEEPQLLRNLIVTGIGLNPLVGKEFKVGDVLCRGTELCTPCSNIQKWTHDGVLKALVDLGGLCAEILEGGIIRPGDGVAVT